MNVIVTQKVGVKIKGEYMGWNQMGNLKIRMRQGTGHRDRSVPHNGIASVVDQSTGVDVTERVMAQRVRTDPLVMSKRVVKHTA